MKDKVVRSPFFYVGDKYKLMPQLRKLFPENISTYIEPFAGGGSSFLNTEAEKYIVNDIDYYVIELHKCLSKYAGKQEEFLQLLYELIDKYELSCSFRNITVPDELKKQYVKTYYSHYNKEAYSKLKDDFNQKQDMIYLYLLLIYGFNHMIRFNGAGKFNLPVGNVDFNKNVYNAICHYLSFMEQKDITFYNMDFMEFLNAVEPDEKSYIYLDPPYLISGSEYNKYWNETEEQRLCKYLDELNERGIRFGITNLINHKGKVNETFLEWSKKYLVYSIDSNYISFNDNTIKADSKEVFVTNYGSK
jgi:DNA adenine methylase Dam